VGMRLAAIQGRAKVVGPLGIAMHHSRTVGEALRYCAEHGQVYTAATRVSLEKADAERSVFLCLEILLARVPYQRQTVEHGLLLMHDHVRNLGGERVRAREGWLTHEPLAPPSAYRSAFGAPVCLGRSVNGLLFAERDLELPIVDRDPQIYKLATSFVEHHFPSVEAPLTARVHTLVERLLLAGDCTLAGVA